MKYQNIIDNMTLKEKAAFLSGKSEWQTRDSGYPGDFLFRRTEWCA